MKLTIIIASTRPGRIGPTIGEWITALARKDDRFEVKVADLLEINLPFLDEPDMPIKQNYIHDHTKKWSKLVDESEAFVIVTPEYNFSPPAPLINALDYLYKEWNYKPVGFVSYGGISGGTRSIEQTKHILTTLKMFPAYEAVNLPFVFKQIENGKFVPNEFNIQAGKQMLDEVYKIATHTNTLNNEK
ncbi:MAG: NAD(P)H-dependent oxidoreductase [bacterium]